MTETKKQKNEIRVRLCNIRCIGRHCGWGYGKTLRHAIDDALAIAREMDPKAYYNPQSGCVCYRGTM